MRLKAILISACALGVLLGACSSSPPKTRAIAPADSTVTIKMFVFKPSPLSVSVGQTVTWTNQDEILHTATSGGPGFPTGVFDGTMNEKGRSFTFTFDKAGTYPYFCNRHNGMRGEILVRD